LVDGGIGKEMLGTSAICSSGPRVQVQFQLVPRRKGPVPPGGHLEWGEALLQVLIRLCLRVKVHGEDSLALPRIPGRASLFLAPEPPRGLGDYVPKTA
jgi:hypothetical protein